MSEIIKRTLKQFQSVKVRTILSVIGVAIGISAVIIVGYISDIGSQKINTELDSLGIDGLIISTDKKTNPAAKLTVKELDELKKTDGVKSAMPLTTQYVNVTTHGKDTSCIAWGIDSGAQQVISLNILHGKPISSNDVRSRTNVCLVDEKFAKETYKRTNITGKKITVCINNNFETFTVAGIVKADSGILQNIVGDYIPNIIYVPYTTLNQLTNKETLDQIAVKIKNKENIDKQSKIIISELEKSAGVQNGFKSQNLSNQRNKLTGILNTISFILTIISGISLIVAGLGIMTVMLVSVHERTKEIGIKKAIGATRKAIMTEFLCEALMIALIGSILGIIIGTAVIYVGVQILDLSFNISYDRNAFAMLFSLLIGGVFGAYPSYKAAKLSPVDALRHE